MIIEINFIFALLIVYQIKHFIADYPLQGKYMLGKFKGGFGWILPLLAHVAVHGIFTFLICAAVMFQYWDPRCMADVWFLGKLFIFWPSAQLAILDMAVHFVMDRIKASPNLLGRFKAITGVDYMALMQNPPQKLKVVEGIAGVALCGIQEEEVKSTFRSNTLFWWCLGLDQMVHHLTHYAVLYFLLTGFWK